jgi:hypothetical protein
MAIESVGKAKKLRKRIQIETAGVEAFKATGVIYFPKARFEGREYQIFLIPNDGVSKLVEKPKE